MNIYKGIEQDFSDMQNYGYKYAGIIKHYVNPSVRYENDRYYIRIGYSFSEGKMYVYRYEKKDNKLWDYTKLCTNILSEKGSYKAQFERVRTQLFKFLSEQ